MPDYGTEDLWWFEEIAMVRGLDEYLDQGAQAVYFRANDIHGNWRRTTNVIEPGFLNNGVNKLYHVNKVGIIEEDYEGNTILAEFCTVPVQNRFNGAYVLDYAAQVLVPNYVQPPFFIMSELSSPTHEPQSQNLIQVPLYRVDPLSGDRYAELDSLFPDVGGDCDVHYYSRGEYLSSPPSNCPQVTVIDSNINQQPLNEWDFQTIPFLFVSDDDSLLGPDGDFQEMNWRDYSIAETTLNPQQWAVYHSYLDSMYFTHKERGRITECDASSGYVDDYKINVLRTGLERLDVIVDGVEVSVPVQSGPDAYFVIADGIKDYATPFRPPPEASNEESMAYGDWWDQQVHIFAIGHFKLSGGAEADITYNEWRDDVSYSDIDWLITPSCSLLNNASYQDWQSRLVDNDHLRAICGFKIMNLNTEYPNGSPADFFERFSANFSYAFGIYIYPQYWWNLQSYDPAIIAWMENACYWARIALAKRDGSDHPECDAAAVDEDRRWILKKADRGLFFRESYFIFAE